MKEFNEKIVIIGAGLCGSLLALRLAQRGYQVEVYEKRPDLRKNEMSAGKSINLAFSNRGMKAMRKVGILDTILPLCIPMKGRMIHDREGNTFLSPYSGREGEYIHSVSRGGLNSVLLDEAEKLPNLQLHFESECTEVDFKNKMVYFKNTSTGKSFNLQADVIFGTDGAGSELRKSYQNRQEFLFSHSQIFLDHGYKELSFPPKENGGFSTDENALHIWPRGQYMLIALPNLDGSFTVTLFLSHSEGKYNFESLKNPDILLEFFQTEFPDAMALMPHLVEEFAAHPKGNLGTVKCSPWNYKGNSMLMGDAAHAVVPFYGQGMNASFEDVVVLDEIIDEYKGNWEKIFTEFSLHRKKDADAIADLAVDNFFEMRDHVANPLFIQKRKIEMLLEQNFPESYHSKYSKVTFNENLPYSDAMYEGRLQDKVILTLLYNNEINGEMEIGKIWEMIQQKLKEEEQNQSINALLNG